MPLTGEELRRRVLAAAELAGIGMRGLRQVLDDYGAPKTLAEAMIRGENPQSPRNIKDLATVLEVPEEWFTVEDPRTLIRPAEGESDAPRVVELATLAEIRGALEEIRTLLVRDDRRAGESGG